MGMTTTASSDESWDHCLSSDEIIEIEATQKIVLELSKWWWKKCNTVNRRLAGARILSTDNQNDQSLISKILEKLDRSSKSQQNLVTVGVLQLVPKNPLMFSQNCFEVLQFDDSYRSPDDANVHVIFRSVQMDEDEHHLPNPHIGGAYSFRLISKQGEDIAENKNSCSIQILTAGLKPHQMGFFDVHILPKLVKLLKNINKTITTTGERIDTETLVDDSQCNRLLDLHSYLSTYTRLKETWGRELVESWTEKTNPAKFVYEDCGIASYLLELWEIHGLMRPGQRFADIGCGNGLLVYLLGREGVNGVGIDVRRRRIWERFEKFVDLREVSLDPSSKSSVLQNLSNVDFLIGNHSDELTPWIPVIAARLRCNFFLLPCCPHDFYSKFMKRNPKRFEERTSTPDQYYSFIESICLHLGFDVRTDQLRIPSRKRKCFIGMIPKEGWPSDEVLERKISELLSSAALRSPKVKFEARPKKEENRNCTNLPVELRENMTNKIVGYLLSLNDKKISGWHCGGSATLREINDQVLNDVERDALRDQNGGLQTFLRNQHQVFGLNRGTVSLRQWPLVYSSFTTKKANVNTRSCWFWLNHPDGCPLPMMTGMNDSCPFAHPPKN